MKTTNKKSVSFAHGQAVRTAILWVILGSPSAPKRRAVRRYLAEFLSDGRVVEIPRVIWQLLLRLVILPFRSGRTAHKYQQIWLENGSPLVLTSIAQGRALEREMRDRHHDVTVATAMRYGSPSITKTLDQLREGGGLGRLVILPAYPQYSATTTASVFDEVTRYFQKQRDIPELRFVKHYHDHGAYIEALAQQITTYWEANGRGDKLLLSFHGIPRANLDKGDPYHCECYKTARLLTQALDCPSEMIQVTFQSRFGRAQWLQPYTSEILTDLATQGLERVDVVCPGFVADCLETLEEIAKENAELFVALGGKSCHYIPCLNLNTEWIRALGDIVDMHLAGWPTFISPSIIEQNDEQRALSRQEALNRGAVE